MSRSRSVTIILSVALAGLVGGVGIATLQNSPENPQLPSLDTPQTAQAEDHGIRLEVNRARFSATGTFVRFDADVAQWEQANGVHVARVAVPGDGWADGLAPESGGAAVSVMGRADSFARLRPVTLDELGGAPRVAIGALEMLLDQGATVRVEGSWTLELTFPSNIRQLLRTERLSGSPPVTMGGVTVRLTGGRRSTTETLVTVEVSPETAVPLGEPRIVVGDQASAGILVDSFEGGQLLTYAFPPTAFGSSVRLEFDTFRIRGDQNAGEVSIDLGRAMAEASVTGKNLEEVRISPEYLSGAGIEPPPVSKVTFYELPFASDGPITAIRIELAANYDVHTTTFSLITAKGREARWLSRNDLYNRDLTGTIRGGTHQLDFEVDMEDVAGTLTLVMGAEPSKLVRGLWAGDMVVDSSVD